MSRLQRTGSIQSWIHEDVLIFTKAEVQARRVLYEDIRPVHEKSCEILV